jgi:hypothetical protein
MEYEEYHIPNDVSQNASGQDDGSLKCLRLPIPDGMKIFKCTETTQQQMENKTFWVFDYDKGVKTRHVADKYIVFFKYDIFALLKRYEKGKINKAKFHKSFESRMGWLLWADCYRLRKKIMSELDRIEKEVAAKEKSATV